MMSLSCSICPRDQDVSRRPAFSVKEDFNDNSIISDDLGRTTSENLTENFSKT